MFYMENNTRLRMKHTLYIVFFDMFFAIQNNIHIRIVSINSGPVGTIVMILVKLGPPVVRGVAKNNLLLRKTYGRSC